MLAEDDDTATNFSIDGYLINERLNTNRELFLQNADILITKAKADALPGYPAAEITKVEAAVTAYEQSGEDRQGTIKDAGEDRIARDKLIKKINSRRYAIQNATDRLVSLLGRRPAPRPPQLRAAARPAIWGVNVHSTTAGTE